MNLYIIIWYVVLYPTPIYFGSDLSLDELIHINYNIYISSNSEQTPAVVPWSHITIYSVLYTEYRELILIKDFPSWVQIYIW